MLLTVLLILAMWTVASIALGLLVGPVIRWGLHDEPEELPPLPSGSLQERSF